ncbi:MAG TPA: Rieske 2Fe-2S domain-containing protein [Ktedonobacteraceae bacterium]|nr:Rieske 2Fe-2S domain-containing protein [Ktedonobacteraceae bacterium]
MCETCGCQGNIPATSSGVILSVVSDSNAGVESPDSPPSPRSFIERLSDALQHGVQVLVGAHRKPPRRFKSLLNGTWFGHPLHPALTDIPITSWLLCAIFDVIWLISPTSFAWAVRAAEVAVIVGLLGAPGSAVTGLTDWSDTYGSERTLGLYHGLLNVTATLLYLVSLILRLQQSSGENIAAAVVGFVGLVAVLVAAYLGGEMVFTKGTGVNHTAWEAGGEDFEVVMPYEGVEENRLYRVMASGVPVVLLRQGTQLFALSATCPHAGGPLDEGTLTGDVVECPWHGSRFCVRDGRVLTGPATVNAPRYEVRVRAGQVEVKRSGAH